MNIIGFMIPLIYSAQNGAFLTITFESEITPKGVVTSYTKTLSPHGYGATAFRSVAGCMNSCTASILMTDKRLALSRVGLRGNMC
jgi:hypothetical protein